jgi:flagellar FliL protein
MAAKADTPTAPTKDAASAASTATSAQGGGAGSWLPVIATLLLAPLATWATVEFLLLPRLQKKISAHASTDAPAAASAESGGHAEMGAGKDGKGGGAPSTYEFQNIVVNLAGTMGTRYLKTSFLVTGASGSDIRGAFEGAKPRLTDVTLNVLSSLTLADLEEPGAKNIIREKLVGAYNQSLGKKVADQVYFSDFVIQ